jgi:hypothetical protein
MALIKFDDYARKYQHIKMERRDGILQMTLHTNDAELKWGMGPHEELSYAFNDVARDHEPATPFALRSMRVRAAASRSPAMGRRHQPACARPPGTTSIATPSIS